MDSFGKYLPRSSLKIWLTGEILVLSRNFAQCIIYMSDKTIFFFTFMAEKTNLNLNHRIFSCFFILPYIKTFCLAFDINSIIKYPGHSTKNMSCIIYDTWGTKGLTAEIAHQQRVSQAYWSVVNLSTVI